MILSAFLATSYRDSRPGISAGAVEQLEVVLRHWERSLGRPPLLADLTDDSVNHFLAQRATVVAPATVNHNRRALLALWRAAYRRRLIQEAPRDVGRAREMTRLPVAWSAEQVATLIAFCDRLPGAVGSVPARLWWSSLVAVAYRTAARVSSLRSATWQQYDPEGGYLILAAESDKTGNERLYRLDQACRDRLAVLPRVDRLLWPWPLCRRSFWIHSRRIVQDCGLPSRLGCRDLFHRLRRSRLTELAGNSLEHARRLAGHTSGAMTLKHYIDPRLVDCE